MLSRGFFVSGGLKRNVLPLALGGRGRQLGPLLPRLGANLGHARLTDAVLLSQFLCGDPRRGVEYDLGLLLGKAVDEVRDVAPERGFLVR